MAEAIACSHQRGVLHRDLKLSNVMIDVQDQPHVTDFGLAKIVERQDELSVESHEPTESRPPLNSPLKPLPTPHTQTGAVMGSPSYMSPEQARGHGGQVSERSDVYALGAMPYELLTTRPPFLAATPLEAMKLVAERELVAPRVLHPARSRRHF